MQKEDLNFKKLASLYLEEDGRRLRQEMAALPDIQPYYPDRTVREIIKKEKSRRQWRQWSAIAAAAVLFFIGSRFMLFERPVPTAPPEVKYELISLSFALPEHFNVTYMEQDKEKTIYYITDKHLDDVILSVERTKALAPPDTFTEIRIGEKTAYGYASADYQILQFEKDDLHYVLSCKHDINTLTGVAASL